MRKIVSLMCAVGLALAVAGCSTTNDPAPVATEIAGKIDQASTAGKKFIAEVQSYATQVCKYVPAAATVAAIFNSGFSASVAVIANAVCDAVTTAPLADGPNPNYRPSVNGVVIQGHFVKPSK